jgi:hypothetical protein
MSDSSSIQSENIMPSQSGMISPYGLDDLKAFFYLYNAKPDTEIRLLKGDKVVELSDITNLEEQVAAKLGNHDVLGQTVSITFYLSSKKIKEFSTWAEFERAKWNVVNDKVEAININWNILIKLPQYKSPQTHSMKLRIGNAIPPKDIFQLFLTSDDISEVMEAQSFGICKVDFINTIIANELLFIVSEWHKGLKAIPDTDVIQKILKKDGKTATQFMRIFLPLFLLVIACNYTEYIYPVIGIDQELSIYSIQSSLVCLLTMFVLGSFLGSIAEKSIDRQIDRLEDYPGFLITKGDQSSVEEFSRKNKKLTNQIVGKVLWILFSVPISSIVKFLISYFNPLKS